MNLKLNKRAILPTFQFLAILICCMVLLLLYIHKHLQLEEQKELNTTLHMQIDLLKIEHEEDLAANNVTIQYLNESNLNINKQKEELQTEVDELKKVIRIIADNLKMSKEDLINKPNISVSRKGGEWQTYYASFYTSSCRGCTGFTYHQGIDVRNTIYHKGKRVIAVDPRYIPLGSLVEIKKEDGTGYEAYAIDIGGAIKHKRIDILVSDTKTAIEKGRQNVQLRIIKRGE